MRPFLFGFVLGALLLAPLQLSAQDSTAAAGPAAAPAASPDAGRHVTRELPLGTADLALVEEMLSQTLSAGGRYSILKIKRTVQVTDTPENIEAARAILGELSKQAAINVRIEVTVQSMGDSRRSGVDVSGRFNTGTVGGRFGPTPPVPPPGPAPGGAPAGTTIVAPPGKTVVLPGGAKVIIPGQGVIVAPGGAPVPPPPPPPGPGPGGFSITGSKGSVNVNPFDQKTGTDSIASQFILVANGHAGVIEVVREVPMVDFFLGYNPGGGFVTPTVRWEKAGTQLLVKPIVSGDMITVEVTPRISQVHFANQDVFARKPLNRPLTGADQYITYTQLTSTVTVQNGGTIQIGGFSNATDEFNRYFFGGSHTTGQTVGTITLKATLQ